MIHIHDFCVDKGEAPTPNYPFSVTATGVVCGLGKLAGLIALGDAMVQSVTVSAGAKVDDFTMTAVTIVFAEKKERAK